MDPYCGHGETQKAVQVQQVRVQVDRPHGNRPGAVSECGVQVYGVEEEEVKTAPCSAHPTAKQHEARIPCWPWTGSFCSECGEVTTNWGWFRQLAWDILIYSWWNGAVLVKEEIEK